MRRPPFSSHDRQISHEPRFYPRPFWFLIFYNYYSKAIYYNNVPNNNILGYIGNIHAKRKWIPVFQPQLPTLETHL